MSVPAAFRAFRIHHDKAGYRAGLETIGLDDLSPGELVIRAAYSSVNYKDALAGTGEGKILRRFPLVGGIDVAGHVVASSDARFREGDAVLCTGCGLSETRDGGYSEYVRLESQWAIPLPAGLDLREAMILGTAGFTAGLALFRMMQNGQTPTMGPVVVTGATGGVGMLAIDILTRAGYEAHAITGKFEQLDFLTMLGARQVVSRRDLDLGQRPLETAIWAGAIDNVGGEMLAGLTRVIKPYGNIASCGLAGGHTLSTTVMPFIIRGVSLLGIASAGTARDIREQVWQRLASDWKPAHLPAICTREVGLDELHEVFPRMLQGESFGRTLVRI
ncbi:YhdH/YhfP family quinone oxidoreductase [Rehaibacterium terrae]|jgi:acrylyl-CoA reductase (NADPH)|uniref:Putative YhdH/YhfP family quinone oxidoreductase n=1 Tax=Rehaibacterium terrae TaxID=1341696 RepID=A0A7W7V8N0_9GAMM|nr:YhdH/YhfP family quinone oxidoreductase [Rehaibacterium terrae]MBB5014359.1 putative YhdH/YhfP family quinone oxidoreductase [Rehaibacterium terrae]